MQEALIGAILPGEAIILLIKATAVLALAWVVANAARRASAAVRHGIWALALGSILALPLADKVLPQVRIDLPAAFRLAVFEEPVVAVLATPTQPTRLPTGERVAPISTVGGTQGVIQAPIDPPGFAPDWAMVLLGLWAAGALARLSWLATVLVRPRRLAWRTARPVGPDCARLANELAAEVGIRRAVRVFEGTFFSMPLAWGVFRPVIIVPTGADKWPAERLRVVLLHELAHIRRWDYVTSVLSEVACAIYWPLPLVWLARRRLQAEQEQACDDRVLSVGTSPLVYADHLLAIARAFYGRRSDLGLTVTMAREVSLKHRVRAILDERTDRRPLRSWEGVTAAAILVAATIPIAALHAAEENEMVGLGDDPVGSVDQSRSRIHAVSGPASLWIEAEWGSIAGDGIVNAELEASEASYLSLRSRPGEPTRASYRFRVDNAGEYRIWARVRRADTDQTRLHAAIGADPGVETLIDWGPQSTAGGWRWESIGGEALNSGNDGTVSLREGGHTLAIRPIHGDLRIDRIVVSDDPTYVPSGRGAINPAIRPAYHLVEAESGDLVGAVGTARGGRASEDGYLLFEAPRLERAGRVDYTVDIEQAGRYIIWGRLSAPTDQRASMWVQVNEGNIITWDGHGINWRWEWDPVSGRRQGAEAVDPMVFNLKAGRNTLAFQARTPGVRLDALLVTNDLAHRPLGLWPASIPAAPVHVWLEAESGRPALPFIVESSVDASGGRAVTVGDQVTGNPGEGGTLRFEAIAPEGGIYSLWGRTLASGNEGNSLYVRVDGGDWILWDRIPGRGGWIWYPVRDSDNGGQLANFRLDAGVHVIEVSGREPGIMLDRLLLTNDPLIGPEAIEVMGAANRRSAR